MEGVRREKEPGVIASNSSFFFFRCGAGWLADGLVTSKMKMNAVKFACANFSSPRWDLERSHRNTRTHIADTHACRHADMRGLALLALNTHHLHAEKVCRRSVNGLLGFGNVFQMFIAIAYVALECKEECYQTLLMSSVITNLVVQR